MESIRNVIVEVVAEVLKVPIETITVELSIGDIPQWGSMAQMSIVSSLQEKFEVEIPLEDLFDLTSVQGLIDEIMKLKRL